MRKLIQSGTSLYLPNRTGGFSVSECPEALALAEDIARAVNSHDDLVAALRRIRDAVINDQGVSVATIDEVLAAAGVSR